MEHFGIYKKVLDPVLPEQIELVRKFSSKALAESALSKLESTDSIHYYIAELK